MAKQKADEPGAGGGVPGERRRIRSTRRIIQPDLYATGTHDVMIDPYGSYAASRVMPNATLLIYSDAGHAFPVAEHALGVDGPLREYDLVGPDDTDGSGEVADRDRLAHLQNACRGRSGAPGGSAARENGGHALCRNGPPR